ncbi:MAG: dihydropteroate synthase [Planctomycetales bacterium]
MMTTRSPLTSTHRLDRATTWKLRTRNLQLGYRPLLMGIVNVTPDSFSDGGDFIQPERAIEHALHLVTMGADILDIGGESTRPYCNPVGAQEELDRVLPVVTSLSGQVPIPLSIDTSKATVARACLEQGVEIINDVTGLEGDPQMVDLAAATGAGVCVMHMQGTPQTMQENPDYSDVVKDVYRYLHERCNVLTAAGVELEKICLDPGIGFGKTHEHNLSLLSHCYRFHELGSPLLVGHSRKGFIAKILGDQQADRTAASIGVALALANQGVQIIRVHDVAAVRQALRLYDACSPAP